MRVAIVTLVFLFFQATTRGQIITTVAGTGFAGAGGDNSAATSAELNTPSNVLFDKHGNMLIADASSHKIRKISTAGVITTFAGTGVAGSTGDGGPATLGKLNAPIGIALDTNGNLFIAEYSGHVVRKVDTMGIITKVAGTGSVGYSGDGGPATDAKLYAPYGVVVDKTGRIYFSDPGNQDVRSVDASGIISTIAGTGSGGYNGDGIPATDAELKNPAGIALSESGELFIADWMNRRIRKINSSGIISTVAGNGATGNDGDGAQATLAKLNAPNGVSIDGDGNIYISDNYANVVRKVNASGIISTVAGNGTLGYSGDGGAATAAQLNTPNSAVDQGGNIYIADTHNHRIRKVTYVSAVNNIWSGATQVNIFPDPAKDEIAIAASVIINSVEVIDMLGRSAITVAPTYKKKVTINIPYLLPGQYMIKVNGAYAGKFLKD